MTYEEMIKKAQSYKMRGKPKNDEHRIQSACVRWFRLKYPKLKNVLFAVPNGGRRDAITGARLKEEGATSGVSDLILLKSNRFYGGCNLNNFSFFVLFIALCQKYIWTEFIISIHSSMIYPLYFADISSAFNFLVSSPFL